MIRIRVPATSANIGPGFDCLGIAFNLYSQIDFEEIEKGFKISGCDEKYINGRNLIYTSFLKTLGILKAEKIGVKITISTEIPPSRGLGSSAACVVSGVAGAMMMVNGKIDKDELLEISTKIEGHPDNVAPAIFGGLTASAMENDKVYSEKFKVSSRLNFYGLIPDFNLSTKVARNVLPEKIPFKDAVNNISKMPLLIKALEEGDMDLIRFSLKDRMHQPYRKKLIYDYNKIKKTCEEIGGSIYLSGAGPSIICVSDKNVFPIIDTENSVKLRNNWDVIKFEIDNTGITGDEN